ncbi:hypothetical protein ACFOST_17845 [Cytobacillus kochii]|uniref:hypothetical protein n=1 Tax=Cytobacillus kochii TaxID=859143 RepID=UPI002789FAF7|nr:hypothetical protein [Cytobacillus kochii]MDQ0186939.1 wyosine [tRNA(Phe)-imidazoG37] synthetase (radical SAM superfamily) [Cytobacillus kochii]
MLPNILLKIENSLKDKDILSIDELIKFMSLLRRYKKGEWLYPGVLIRKLNITSSKAYKVLEILKDMDVLEVNYELYCHTCNTFEGTIYETFSQMPTGHECEGCDTELQPLINSIVIYKVIFDGE